MHLKLTHSVLCQVYVNLEEGHGKESGRDHGPRTNFGGGMEKSKAQNRQNHSESTAEPIQKGIKIIYF